MPLDPAAATDARIDLLHDEPPTAAERRRERALRMRSAIADTRRDALGGVVAAALVVLLDWRDALAQAGPWLPLLWFAALSLLVLHAIRSAARFTRTPRDDERTIADAGYFAWSNAAAGALWGGSAWVVLPTADAQLESVLVIGHALVLMGSVGSKSLYRPWALCFLWPAMVVFDLRLLWLGDPYHLALAGILAVFAGTLVALSRSQESTLRDALILRFRTEQLLGERTAQQRETQLAREEAERANRGKTTFLVGAGHDLRQPMHAIVQYHGQLRRRNADPALEDTIARIGKSLDSMQDLLDSILDVSKLMMGSIRPMVSSFELAPMLERLEAQMQPVALDKGLRLVIRQDAALPLRTDPVLLERILRNLVLNAIRYTEHGGVLVDATRRGARVSIRVADSGIGIARDERERIFEAFYQVDNQARDRRKGLGLGLAIVHQLAELLDVRLRLRSRPGRGSVFSVGLPVCAARLAPDAKAAGGPVGDFARGAFVVLVDDSEESLEATAASLQGFGCRVLAASSSARAIERLAEEADMPQLIVSDFRLERENGLQAIDNIVAHQKSVFGPELDIAAIIVSGDTGPVEMGQVLRAGHPMLHKPVPLDSLHAAVNQQLARLASGQPVAH